MLIADILYGTNFGRSATAKVLCYTVPLVGLCELTACEQMITMLQDIIATLEEKRKAKSSVYYDRKKQLLVNTSDPLYR